MPLESSSIPNLVNGVSQQPSSLRLQSQCTLQENGYSSVVKGVRKRPPFRHVAKLTSSTYGDAHIHTINRDSVERYEVVIVNGDLFVYDMAGNAKTVTFPNGKGYLTTATPSTSIKALTVADYTFVVNTSITTAMSGSVTSAAVHEAMFYVRQGGYAAKYVVIVNSSGVASYTTSATTTSDIATDNIATNLYNQMVAAGLNSAPWSVSVSGSLIYLTNASSDFTINTTDSIGDKALTGIKDVIQNFTSLPAKAKNNFIVKVTGDQSSDFDDYYVKYSDTNGTSSTGTWIETVKQGTQYHIDASTMPYQLVRNGDGTFTFSQVTWTDRLVGDTISAPDPSFIGRTINDVFFHRARLGFIAGENVILSKNGQFFDFFRDTVTTVLDSDPIDVAVNHTKVSTLKNAVAYDTALLLFSDQTQFVLTGDPNLTPKTVSVKPTTEFESYSQAKPVFTSKNVYFAVPKGSYSALREYQTLPLGNDVKDALDVSGHVPSYIPANIFKIAASSNENILCLLTSNERNALYVYKYFWNGDQKLQSSWSKWLTDPNDVILNVDFINTDLWAVIQRSDGIYLEVMSIELGRQDAGFTFQVAVDRRTLITGVFNSGTGLTTWTLPYSDNNGTFQVILGSTFLNPNRVGTVLATSHPTATTLTAVGDFSAGACYVGKVYTFRYRFSPQVVRESKASGTQQAILEGRLQLKHFDVTFEQSGYFRAEVTPVSRTMNIYPFTGHLTGLASNVIGNVCVIDGTFKFPIMSDASSVLIDIVSDAYLPVSLQAAEWEGIFYLRSQRV